MIKERKNNENDVMVVLFVSSFSHMIFPETLTEMDVKNSPWTVPLSTKGMMLVKCSKLCSEVPLEF